MEEKRRVLPLGKISQRREIVWMGNLFPLSVGLGKAGIVVGSSLLKLIHSRGFATLRSVTFFSS